jgi:hypothetical protein
MFPWQSKRSNLVKDGHLVDFYHGWLIEILQIRISQYELSFEAVCYSPCREKICDYQVHSSEFEAMKTARQMIDWYEACQLLRRLLQQFYEAGQLGFEEWRSLHQSLITVTKAR